MKIRFRSLESRISTLFLLLIIVVQVIGLVVIQQGIVSNARTSIASELANGEKVFQRQLEQSAQNRRFSAQVLARDTGFVQAVGNNASGDRDTIESALANSGRRAKAELTMLLTDERKVLASTGVLQVAGLEKMVSGLLDQAEQGDGAVGVALVDQRPYQIVVMPVKAPITIAWVVMGFAIDARIAKGMKDLSGLDVSILTRERDGRWSVIDSTLPPGLLGTIASQMPGQGDKSGGLFDLDAGGSKYSARIVPVGPASVVLARSIDEATAEYKRLERRLVFLTIIGIVVAGVVSVITAKRIAQPLRELAGTARRLERGDYKGQIDVRREDEIGALAKAFDSMRDGIARREQEVKRLAYWDTLTNLPNRAQFVVLLNESIAEARKREQTVFVIMMDLDRFKHVNDVLGHSFGDAMLCQVAERLQLQVAEAHTTAQVARLGGDEFAILLPGSDMAAAQMMAGAILHALEMPLSLEDQTVDIGAGLGIAGYPMHAADAEALLSMAEVAMYTAKQRNDGAVVYDSAIDKSSEKSLSLLTELRHAIERGEFRLHVQPKIALGSGAVVGIESLVRWMHPTRGNVFPDEFIPFAEKTGFIRVLTGWVLDQSAALCQQLEAKGVHLKVSVNLSTRDLLDQDLPKKFRDILTRYDLSPGSFCLEITESAIMDDPVRAEQTLHRLHTMGVDLSIDDFGTGYSSLAY
ncbi:MAG: EAL domain-containing protein, partial [Pseudomonadota bacterium]